MFPNIGTAYLNKKHFKRTHFLEKLQRILLFLIYFLLEILRIWGAQNKKGSSFLFFCVQVVEFLSRKHYPLQKDKFPPSPLSSVAKIKAEQLLFIFIAPDVAILSS